MVQRSPHFLAMAYLLAHPTGFSGGHRPALALGASVPYNKTRFCALYRL